MWVQTQCAIRTRNRKTTLPIIIVYIRATLAYYITVYSSHHWLTKHHPNRIIHSVSNCNIINIIMQMYSIIIYYLKLSNEHHIRIYIHNINQIYYKILKVITCHNKHTIQSLAYTHTHMNTHIHTYTYIHIQIHTHVHNHTV